MQEIIDKYLDNSDWRIKENSNSNYTFAGLKGHVANEAMKEWALVTLYDGEIGKAHEQGFIHIHDLNDPIIGYCAGWGMEDILLKGFNVNSNYIYSRPPKNLNTLFNQMNNFLFTLTNEWAGAQALNSVDTYSAGFIKYNSMTDYEIRKCIETLVYNLNVKTRIAMQAPFTNFSFDLTIPDDLRGRKVIIGGEEVEDLVYGDCQEEVDRFNKIFAEVMTAGDGSGKMFTFPIITYGITENFPWGSELSEKIFTFADEMNSPYFSNFINSDQEPSEIRSMCCRLRLDLTELMTKSGGLFGAGDKTGSLGVITLNLPRIAYISKNRDLEALKDFKELEEAVSKLNDSKEIYFKILDYFSDLSRDSLLIKREAVEESLEKGLLPYTKRYLGDLNSHFNTLGVNGGHEACLILLDAGIDSDEGKIFMVETLEFLLEKCSQYQTENKNLLWNLEATPAEGASTRFAKLDKKQFENIITGAGTGDDYYTNSTQLPDDFTDNIYEVFDHQNNLQPLYTSGTVQHIYMNEPVHNWKTVESLVKKLFTNFKLPYLSISADITFCPICGKLPTKKDYCDNYHDPKEVERLIEEGILNKEDVIEGGETQ